MLVFQISEGYVACILVAVAVFAAVVEHLSPKTLGRLEISSSRQNYLPLVHHRGLTVVKEFIHSEIP